MDFDDIETTKSMARMVAEFSALHVGFIAVSPDPSSPPVLDPVKLSEMWCPLGDVPLRCPGYCPEQSRLFLVDQPEQISLVLSRSDSCVHGVLLKTIVISIIADGGDLASGGQAAIGALLRRCSKIGC